MYVAEADISGVSYVRGEERRGKGTERGPDSAFWWEKGSRKEIVHRRLNCKQALVPTISTYCPKSASKPPKIKHKYRR
jgi:hypothetical protein